MSKEKADFIATSLHGKSQNTQIHLRSIRSISAFTFMSLQKDVCAWSCTLLHAQLPATTGTRRSLGNFPFQQSRKGLGEAWQKHHISHHEPI